MLTAVDSSVLLDVITDSEDHAEASEKALRQASSEGSLIVCECVLAEIRPALREEDVTNFLTDWQLRFIPSSQQSALMAGELYAQYLQRGGKAKRIIADFLIGAHAKIHSDRLLARDRGYLRDYFTKLKLWEP